MGVLNNAKESFRIRMNLSLELLKKSITKPLQEIEINRYYASNSFTALAINTMTITMIAYVILFMVTKGSPNVNDITSVNAYQAIIIASLYFNVLILSVGISTALDILGFNRKGGRYSLLKRCALTMPRIHCYITILYISLSVVSANMKAAMVCVSLYVALEIMVILMHHYKERNTRVFSGIVVLSGMIFIFGYYILPYILKLVELVITS